MRGRATVRAACLFDGRKLEDTVLSFSPWNASAPAEFTEEMLSPEEKPDEGDHTPVGVTEFRFKGQSVKSLKAVIPGPTTRK